jgi:hypothetical protein
MSKMNDKWHDIMSSSSSEDSEIITEKEEFANEMLKIHIPCYYELSSRKDLKWSFNVNNIDILVAYIMWITYCSIIQKLKATNVFKQ